jgi:hypothetical protein
LPSNDAGGRFYEEGGKQIRRGKEKLKEKLGIKPIFSAEAMTNCIAHAQFLKNL